MDLFTYLLGKKGQNTHRDLFSYLLGKGAGGSGTYVNFTGTSLNISNTLRARIKNITLKGATSQTITTGKNLFKPFNFSKTLFGITFTYNIDGSIKANGTSTNTTSSMYSSEAVPYLITLEAGTYTISGGSSNVRLGVINANGSQLAGTPSGGSTSFTIENQTQVFVRAQISSGITVTNEIVYPQLEKGSTATEYEEYTGGNPSPSPSYPQPIKVVTGEQNVNIQNLNLLPFTNQDFNLYGITAKVTDGNLYLNGTTTNEILTSNALYKQYFSFLLKSGTYYFARGVNLSNAGIGATIKRYDDNTTLVQNNGVITITEDTTVYLGIYINKKSFSNLLIDAILTPGNQLIPYIPCGEQNYPLSLGTLELAKIGTYQDYIYGSPNNWYKYKYIGKQIYDGSENWQTSSATGSLLFRLTLAQAKAYKCINVLSNYFTSAGGAEISNNQVKNRFSNFYNIEFRYDTITTVSDWKTWLSTHNVVLYYILVEPTTEQITDTTLIEQLNNLYNATSQDGTTYITCSSASDDNEIIVFSGDIKVASVGLGNPLNISLLSSNIQEETNINDIKEEPNVDEVNEIEDIEQNNEPIEEPIEEEVS